MKLLTVLMLSAGLLSPAFVGAAPAAPAKAAKAGPVAAPLKVTSVEGITEYRLGNGMRVLLLPDASKPNLTTNIVYMVGSRHENYGETGMAHLLEHLLFKPSKNFSGKNGQKTPVEVLNATGAHFNGTTSYDRTNYYATFPANDENLKTMLALEADRMVNANIDQNDLWNKSTQKGEMTVVRNEFESGESNPMAVISERIQAVAFDWHNYGKSTIGARSDIEQVNINHLRAFYTNYYQPDNAVLVVAGRFEQEKVLKQINELFGRIPKPARVLAPTYTAEPVQDGERQVTVRRSGGTQFVGVGYHIAPSGHADAVALDIVGRVLADMPGGRLHKALVESKLATRVFYNGANNLEAAYGMFGAVVPKDGQLEQAQEAMLKVIEGLKSEPITQAEMARAVQAEQAQMSRVMNDTARLASSHLTEALASGDWRLVFSQRDQLEKLDLASVQAAANKYLLASNRTVGRFVPTDAPQRAEMPATPDFAVTLKDYKGKAAVAQGEAFDASPANIDARTERVTLAGGIKAALLQKKTKGGEVSVTLKLNMGTADNLRGKSEAGAMAANLLTHGTETMSRQEIKDTFDKLKVKWMINGGPEGVQVTLTTVRENLGAAVDLVAQLLKKPAFAPVEFEEAKRALVANIERQMPEPQPLVSNAFSRLIDATPEGHIRHVDTLQQKLAKVKALKLEDVKAFHGAFYGAGSARLAAVGDFDAAALKSQVSALFGNWKAQQDYQRVADTNKATHGDKIVLETPDKANSFLMAVLPLPLKDDAPDYPALMMADHMLGGGALHSRLADRIRQKEGLSYGIGSQLVAPSQDPAAIWLAYAISAPQNTRKVEAAMREEIAKALAEGFSQSELDEARKGWLQGEQVQRTGDESLARRLGHYLNFDRTMAYDGALEAKVAALSVAQVNAALRAYVKPADIAIVSAGDFAKAGAGAAAAAK
ncbi:MAG: pitrilysin family protein [Pseudomonadota bacterium]